MQQPKTLHLGIGNGVGDSQSPRQDSSPTYAELAALYRLRKLSVLAAIGSLALLCGICGVILCGFYAIFKPAPILGIDLYALLTPYLAPSIIISVAGAFILALDFIKRKFVCPYPFEVKSDFIRYMCQEQVFPHGMTRQQFKCRVKHKARSHYLIKFNLDAPGSSYRALVPHMENVAHAFGASEKYVFEEDRSRPSRYSWGYQYRFEIVLLSTEKAYEQAGKYHG